MRRYNLLKTPVTGDAIDPGSHLRQPQASLSAELIAWTVVDMQEETQGIPMLAEAGADRIAQMIRTSAVSHNGRRQ